MLLRFMLNIIRNLNFIGSGIIIPKFLRPIILIRLKQKEVNKYTEKLHCHVVVVLGGCLLLMPESALFASDICETRRCFIGIVL